MASLLARPAVLTTLQVCSKPARLASMLLNQRSFWMMRQATLAWQALCFSHGAQEQFLSSLLFSITELNCAMAHACNRQTSV